MKKNIFSLSAIGMIAMLIACTPNPQGYTITGTIADSTLNGTMVYMQNLDNREVVDSAIIENNQVVFTGTTSDTAQACRIVAENRQCVLILENGKIQIDFEKQIGATGTPLNNELNRIYAIRDSLQLAYQKAYEAFEGTNKEWETIYLNEWKPNLDQQIANFFIGHTNDAVGFYLLDFLYGMEVDEQLSFINQFGPWLSNTNTVVKMKSMLENQKKTSVGEMFTDINGTDINGNPTTLSAYVGKGNYVLVDMWASWCGPCRREIPNLANLYKLYKEKGLTVLGIYVWDKKENLLPAIEKEGITWPQIIDSEEVATQLYGVQGIPCIMLIGPDGTILDRTNLRGESMQPTVEKFMFGEEKK